MAYYLQFTGLSTKGKKILDLEPHWWSIEEVRSWANLRWVESNETGSYTDEDAEVSADEARSIHEHFKPQLLELIKFNTECADIARKDTDQYAELRLADYEKYLERLLSAKAGLDAAFGVHANRFSHFHICIAEWESGL